MVKAVVFENCGAPDVLQIRELPELSPPGVDDIVIRQTAIGINDIDVDQRKGIFKLPEGQKICGYEAVGVIESLGQNVTKFEIGDRVAYATAPMGAYVNRRCIHQNYVFKIPEELSDHHAIANLFKGLTGHYLTKRVFMTNYKTAVLVHDGGNATAQAVIRFALDSGAPVIATVRTEAEKEVLAGIGCEHIYTFAEDWGTQIKSLTNNLGVTAVYDSVGKDVFVNSLKCLMPMGMYINYGESSGKLPPINAGAFGAKSLFFTKPSIFHYKYNRMELILSVNEVFEKVIKGILNLNFIEFSIDEAVSAHTMLESFDHNRAIILRP